MLVSSVLCACSRAAMALVGVCWLAASAADRGNETNRVVRVSVVIAIRGDACALASSIGLSVQPRCAWVAVSSAPKRQRGCMRPMRLCESLRIQPIGGSPAALPIPCNLSWAKNETSFKP